MRLLGGVLAYLLCAAYGLYVYVNTGGIFLLGLLAFLIIGDVSTKLIARLWAKDADLDERDVWGMAVAGGLAIITAAIVLLTLISSIVLLFPGREVSQLAIGPVQFLTVTELSGLSYDLNFHRGMWVVLAVAFVLPLVTLALLLGNGKGDFVHRLAYGSRPHSRS